MKACPAPISEKGRLPDDMRSIPSPRLILALLLWSGRVSGKKKDNLAVPGRRRAGETAMNWQDRHRPTIIVGDSSPPHAGEGIAPLKNNA